MVHTCERESAGTNKRDEAGPEILCTVRLSVLTKWAAFFPSFLSLLTLSLPFGPDAVFSQKEKHSICLWPLCKDKAMRARNLTHKLLHKDYGQLAKGGIYK